MTWKMCAPMLVVVLAAGCGGRTPLEEGDGFIGEGEGGRPSQLGSAGRSNGGSAGTEASGGNGENGPCPALPGPPLEPFPKLDGSTACIDGTEVTGEDYAAFLAANPDPSAEAGPCTFNATFVPLFGWPPSAADAARPVVNVDWCDAKAYCAWAGKHLCGAPSGSATPFSKDDPVTSSSWQIACSRNGTRTYPYGNAYQGATCNGKDSPDASGTIIEEGSACEGGSPGIYDLSGNVWEWQDDCESDEVSASCVVRGGSFRSDQENLTCSSSQVASRMSAFDDFGIRCCF